MHWDGQVPRHTVSDSIVTGTDFYPTILEMLGLPMLPQQHLDGVSFVPALKMQPHQRGPVYWHFPHYSNHGYQSPGGAVRHGRYKLLEYYENGTGAAVLISLMISESGMILRRRNLRLFMNYWICCTVGAMMWMRKCLILRRPAQNQQQVQGFRSEELGGIAGKAQSPLIMLRSFCVNRRAFRGR